MKTLLSLVVALITVSLIADADARRFGGARSIGKQRSAITQQQAAPKAPAQQQQQTQPAQNAAAQQPAGASKWLGPLAGLALGAGLAALFLNNGMAGLLAGLLLLGLLVAAAIFAARALRGRAMRQEPLRYAAAGPVEPTLVTLPGGAGANSVAATTSRWPAGFDAAEFARHARRNFVRMQEAHDKGDLAMMREMLTPEMYREIEADLAASGKSKHATDVVTLEAEVLDVSQEQGSYAVSVRFSGLIREDGAAEATPFAEVWHLEKPVSGGSGWLVAGIQQS